MKAWQVPHSLLWQRTSEFEDHLLIRMFFWLKEIENTIGTIVSKEESFAIKETEKSRHDVVRLSLILFYRWYASHPQPSLLPLVAAWLLSASAWLYPVLLEPELKRECLISSNSRSTIAVITVAMTRIKVSSSDTVAKVWDAMITEVMSSCFEWEKKSPSSSSVSALLPERRKAVDVGNAKTTCVHCSQIRLTLSLHEATCPVSLQSCFKIWIP